MAVQGGHGEGEGMPGNADILIPHGDQSWQDGIVVEPEVEGRAVFQANFTGRAGREVAREVESAPHIDGHQRRQVRAVLGLLQGLQAGVDVLGAAGRVPKPSEDRPQHRWRDFLRPAIGVDPVHRQAGAAGEDFQLGVAHGRSPVGDGNAVPAVRLTTAQWGAKVPCCSCSKVWGG
ncbi:hypothetical protein D3C78_881670 [compost metagenome]